MVAELASRAAREAAGAATHQVRGHALDQAIRRNHLQGVCHRGACDELRVRPTCDPRAPHRCSSRSSTTQPTEPLPAAQRTHAPPPPAPKALPIIAMYLLAPIAGHCGTRRSPGSRYSPSSQRATAVQVDSHQLMHAKFRAAAGAFFVSTGPYREFSL